jgi:hypothetical protein
MVTLPRRPTECERSPEAEAYRAIMARAAEVLGPLVHQAILGRLTGSATIIVDFSAGRPLLVEPGIRWKEDI